MCPLTCRIIDDPESVEFVFGEKILGIVVLFGLLKTAEEVVRLADGDDRVSRSRARLTTLLLDLMPSYRQGHRDQQIKKIKQAGAQSNLNFEVTLFNKNNIPIPNYTKMRKI